MRNRFFEMTWRRLFAQTTHRGLLNAFFIFIAFVFLFQCLSIGYTYTLISNQFLEYQHEILEQAGLKLNGIIEKLAIAEKQVIYLVNASPLFRRKNPVSLESAGARDFEYDLRGIRRTNNDINEIYVILPDFTHVLSSSVEHFDRDILLSQPILQEAAITDRSSHVSATHGADYIGFLNDGVNAVSFVRMIRNVEEYQKAAAIIQIDLNYASISDVLKDITLGTTQYIYLVNGKGQVMADQQNKYLGMEADKTGDSRLAGYNQKPGIHPLQNAIVVSYKLEAADWQLVARIDYLSMLGTILSSISVTLLILLATLSLLLYLATFFTKKLSQPLKELMDHMGSIKGDTLSPVKITSGNADMLVLSQSFNAMLERIGQLIISNQKQENERAKAEYMAHMMQINPHFLYNTLDTMRSIALREGVPSVADIAKSMALLFKYSIDNQSEYASLAQEIENVQNYINIQRYRFGQRMELFLDVSDELRNKCVLKFVLQPMVENAMEHGWTRRVDQYLVVVIRATLAQGDLVVSVHDNGAGISQEKLQFIRERLSGGKDDSAGNTRFGIGLMNVHSRMRYRYGEGYGLTIEAGETGGTQVILRFPCEPLGKEAEDV